MPDNDQYTGLKRAAQVTPLLLLVMLIGSLIFYKESMLFSDNSHNLFRIINHQHLEIEASRWGIFISQLFPLICEKLHLPLPVVMMSYAASFYVFYFVVALLLIYKYRSYTFAVLLGLFVTLLVSDSYYYLNNEGIPWLLLVFALNFCIAANKRPQAVLYLVFIPTVYFALWTHPLVMMVAVYLWFFLMADKENWPYTKTQSNVLTAILLLLSLWKFYEGMHHGYDSAKIEVLTAFHPQMLLHLYDAPQFHFLLKSFVTNYWLFSITFIIGMIAMLREKRYWLSLLTLGVVGAYFVLLCITYWSTESRRFYMEIEYMPLAAISSTPFVYFVLPKLNWKVNTAAIVFIYLVRLGYMHHAIQPFSDRLALLEKMSAKMTQKNLTKVVLTDLPEADSKTLIMDWGAPVESALLSKLKGEEPQRTFIFKDAGQFGELSAVPANTFMGCWEMWGPEKINHFYFSVDTTQPYKVMAYEELMR